MGPALARILAAALLLASCGPGASHPKVLINDAGGGNSTETFVVSSDKGWDLYWSYDDCGGQGVFVVDVFKADRSPDFKHPGVNEEGAMDSAVYHVPERGRFYLEITTTCRWSVTVIETP